MQSSFNISKKIKTLTKEIAIQDYIKLTKMDLNNLKTESCIGNKFVDYFTFEERLNTISRKGMNYYEFLLDTDYHARPYIQNLLVRQEKLLINMETKLYRIFTLHCGSVSIFKPLKALEVYNRFKPQHILDPCAGWGGRLVGACAAGVLNYTGIDCNANLKEPYLKMIDILNELTNNQTSDHGLKGTPTKIQILFQDALLVDYSKIDYDMIFTSPPYYNIELYSGTVKRSKQEWTDGFYKPLFSKVFEHLLVGGHMCINISIEIYNEVFLKLFGAADIIIPMNIKARPTTSKAMKEFIYCWKKKAATAESGQL